MKFLAVFISLLVLVLNGMPCCADDCSSEDFSEQQETNSHSNELCFPFLSCGSCNAVVFQEEPSEMSFLDPIGSQELSEAEKGLFSEFTLRIWQPPKNS
ncbi:hypothetical protein [Salinimicrobium terrae]|uniref:hypothetical protein n=1 Tax=Salinimicrobium terrae TaxID=470866 RepID=UPI0012EC88C8|nr:hypothetical protein [Salinimicrobium terrae]